MTKPAMTRSRICRRVGQGGTSRLLQRATGGGGAASYERGQGELQEGGSDLLMRGFELRATSPQ